MSDSPIPKKSEGWLGLVLTAILCLGFLYWWFRPARETWQPHTTAQLVARALAEPGLNEPLERLVIDFDLMEVALLQARQGMVPEGLETASRIGDSVVQARTIRQLAQAHLQQDAKNLGISLTMCDRIADTARRARMKEEILLQIALLGFGDVALAEAKTPLLRARVARRLAETDGQDTARTLLAELEAAQAQLPPDQAALLLPEFAWTRVQLAITDGPQQAFEAIRRLPAADQEELWLELFGISFGRGETQAALDTAAVAAQAPTPALRRKFELEALQSGFPLRPAADILAELDQAVKAAAPGAAHIRALIELAKARSPAGGPEATAIPLHAALEEAAALKDPVQRAAFLAELAELLPDALLFAESKKALQDATDAAHTIVAPEQQVPQLVMVMSHAFKAGEIKTASDLATQALALAPKITLADSVRLELADFLTRIGDWPAALSLLPAPKPVSGEGLPASTRGKEPSDPRAELLDALSTTAAEDIIGYPANDPPNRGEPLDRIRNRAISDQAAAAAYLPGLPAGPARARATLAIAKGLLLPPLPAAEPNLPSDPTTPLDVLPGQETTPPVAPLPEDTGP